MKVGVLGAGQLGRMLAIAGYPLELDCKFFDTTGSPSVGLGDVFSEPDACPRNKPLKEFLSSVDVVTYEFEHLPLHLVEYIATEAVLHPSAKALKVCQNRREEKALFDELGIPTAKYRVIKTLTGLKAAVKELGTPVVCKTTTEGYDGKGQFVIRDAAQCEEAWDAIGDREILVEAFVNFSRELSIIAARNTKGEVKFYPLADNVHHEGILRYSTAPAPGITREIEKEADDYIKRLICELDYVGILTLEMFETENGLVANEMAPRVHNSGHWSIEGTYCSQFENHMRCIAGLPVGNTEAKTLSCMINIISEKGDIESILKLPYAHMHLYGKSERKGRKLGHVTVQADSYEELAWRVKNVAEFLPGSPEFEGYGK